MEFECFWFTALCMGRNKTIVDKVKNKSTAFHFNSIIELFVYFVALIHLATFKHTFYKLIFILFIYHILEKIFRRYDFDLFMVVSSKKEVAIITSK